MGNSLLPQDFLNAVRKRCDATTKGIWESLVEGRDHTSGDSYILMGEDGNKKELYLIGGTVADQDFIANAHQDVLLLLDEIDSLRRFLVKE
jgi:hypothetical protein